MNTSRSMSKTMSKSESESKAKNLSAREMAMENMLSDALVTKDNCQIIRLSAIRIAEFGEELIVVLPNQEFIVDDRQEFRWYRNSTDKKAVTIAMLTTCAEGPECLISPIGANFILLVESEELAHYILARIAPVLDDEVWDKIEELNLVMAEEQRKIRRMSPERWKKTRKKVIDGFNRSGEEEREEGRGEDEGESK